MINLVNASFNRADLAESHLDDGEEKLCHYPHSIAIMERGVFAKLFICMKSMKFYHDCVLDSKITFH